MLSVYRENELNLKNLRGRWNSQINAHCPLKYADVMFKHVNKDITKCVNGENILNIALKLANLKSIIVFTRR